MALPTPRDLDAARPVLGAWLARQLDGATDVRVSEIGGPPATGFSNETLIFDASWRESSGAEGAGGFVVRVQPTSHAVFPTDTLALQARAMGRWPSGRRCRCRACGGTRRTPACWGRRSW